MPLCFVSILQSKCRLVRWRSSIPVSDIASPRFLVVSLFGPRNDAVHSRPGEQEHQDQHLLDCVRKLHHFRSHPLFLHKHSLQISQIQLYVFVLDFLLGLWSNCEHRFDPIGCQCSQHFVVQRGPALLLCRLQQLLGRCSIEIIFFRKEKDVVGLRTSRHRQYHPLGKPVVPSGIFVTPSSWYRHEHVGNLGRFDRCHAHLDILGAQRRDEHSTLLDPFFPARKKMPCEYVADCGVIYAFVKAPIKNRK